MTTMNTNSQAPLLEVDGLRTYFDTLAGTVRSVDGVSYTVHAGQIVEQASALDLFDNPEHPYTEALLGALPQIEGAGIREGRLTAIPGRPPDLGNPPPACRFGPRCPYADRGDSCTKEEPELREVRPGHLVRSAHPASERARKPTEVSA